MSIWMDGFPHCKNPGSYVQEIVYSQTMCSRHETASGRSLWLGIEGAASAARVGGSPIGPGDQLRALAKPHQIGLSRGLALIASLAPAMRRPHAASQQGLSSTGLRRYHPSQSGSSQAGAGLLSPSPRRRSECISQCSEASAAPLPC